MPRASEMREIIERLVLSAQGREPTSSEPWDYGWSQPSYRRSGAAAMTHGEGTSVKLNPQVVHYFEEAAGALLQLPRIHQRYDSDEFWGMTASLVGTLPLAATSDDLAKAVELWIEQVLDPPDSVVVLPVANLGGPESAIDIGPILLGQYCEQFVTQLREKVGRRVMTQVPQQPWWMKGPYEASAPPPVLFAYMCRTQLNRAIEEAGEALEDLTSIALMVQPDLDALSLYSLRGDAYRPGVRGLVADRLALGNAAEANSSIFRELTSEMVADGVFGQTVSYRAYGECPFPLEKLLEAPEKVSVARQLLLGSNAVHHRLRVAARWHAKAHWSLDLADAVLALGICFDSMLSERGPSPGRVLSERFALLDPDPNQRRHRYRQFQAEYYPARSSVAHGAKSGSLETAFVRGMAKDARWVFQRVIYLTEMLGVSTEDEYDGLYQDLKWGVPSTCPGD